MTETDKTELDAKATEPTSEEIGEVTAEKEGEGEAPVIIREEREESATDYAEIVRADIKALSSEFPELKDLSDISELDNPLRYGALRDLGLTPAEAYLATTKRRRTTDNRAHLERAVPRGASVPLGAMSERELSEARDIFSDISDAEIKRLYRKVTR